MATTVGVDWGGKRWVVAVDSEGEIGVETAPSIQAVWARHGDAADRILVDIPIGLPDGPDDSPRPCDRAAREFLDGARRSSVFAVPCRQAVEAPDYDAAREANEATLDASLGAQSWGIAERIHEVDAFLRSVETDGRLRESHPEVCFAALSADGGESVTASKHDEDGLEHRLGVLESHDPAYRETYEGVREATEALAPWKRRLGLGMLDDVADAMALALTARLGLERGFAVLGDGRRDAAGLPMEIVYAEPAAR